MNQHAPPSAGLLNWSRGLSAAWNGFWFEAVSAQRVLLVRIAICSFAAIWLLSYFGELSTWFGVDGLLHTSLAARLIEFEETPRWQHWSPLWWTDSSMAYQAWLAAGIVLSLLAIAGVGGRATMVGLLVVIIGWIHRITWIQGPVEPALAAMVAYLVVAPGPAIFGSRSPLDASWLNNTALRLIQVHWWLLLAAGLCMQLGGMVWWRGEAVWWLASSGRSHLFGIDALRDSPTLVNLLTHSMVLVQGLALWLIVVPAARPLGIVFGLLAALSIGLIADQLLYGLLLASCLTAFVAYGSRRPN